MWYKKNVMLSGALRTIINKLFLKSFYHYFHGKYILKKKLSKKLITLLFSHKTFLKIVSKPMPLRYSLTFPKKKKKKRDS